MTKKKQPKKPKAKSKTKSNEIEERMNKLKFKSSFSSNKISSALKKIDSKDSVDIKQLPDDVKQSQKHLKSKSKRFHGAKLSKYWFPKFFYRSKCSNKFGYMTPFSVRKSSRLPFNATNQALVSRLGDLMGNSGREAPGDSNIPAGYTYFGQFVDHDITLDVSSTLDSKVNANKINNMRTPSLDLDNVYGRGPAVDPHMYVFPTSGNATAIKLLLGKNRDTGPGGPGGADGFSGMVVQKDFDVPRMPTTNTAVIGDPRNDENLIISQFQHAMLKFHNNVVNMLLLDGFTGDIFVEAKKIVTHHYQWVVIKDFLKRICGNTAVNNALKNVKAKVGSSFKMPVEFSVAAYRFGHSMIRNEYWVNFNFPNATLGEVFEFIRPPRLPVFSNWVVDFNAFVSTGVSVPVFNNARRIDSVLANGLESLPGFTGIMAILAIRNLRRGLAFGLPSGQAVAKHFGIKPLTSAQLTSDLPQDEIDVLEASGGILLKKTPLWYYILREAMVKKKGDQLGPVGAKIVADTFVRMLKRDEDSYINKTDEFKPFLPSTKSGDFTLADLIKFAGVNLP